MKKYHSLYSIVRKKNKTVVKVLSTAPLNVSFRRAIVGDKMIKRLDLVGSVISGQLVDQRDSFV
jgi:hypothetical protein